MAVEGARTWTPEWTVAPGAVLAEALSERGLSQSELARRMDRPTKTINEIVNGKAAITPDTAIQLERTLGISAGFWNNLELLYREQLARSRDWAELAESEQWISNFPISALARHELIDPGRSKPEVLSQLLSFFGVSGTSAWQRQWMATDAAFRSSPAFASHPYAVATWLRWGELRARDSEVKKFDRPRFVAALAEARGLTRSQPVALVVPQLDAELREAGVHLVLLPELGSTRLSGSARWLANSEALIQLSLRYKTDDQFWFTFFHEAGHLLNSSRRRSFIDTPDDVSASDAEGDERAADEFARDALLPKDAWEQFVTWQQFDATAIRAFADDQRIAPGIVVGRLQHDGHIPRNQSNHLKQKLGWGANTGR